MLAGIIQTERRQRQLRGYAGTAARVATEERVVIEARVNVAAVEEAKRRLGGRGYVTHASAAQVSLEKAVLASRAASRSERDLARLQGKPRALAPLYGDADRRVTGLVRRLTIGLRVLTLLEFVARRALAHPREPPLEGLYAGNLTRATSRPPTEVLLRVFQALTLIVRIQGALRIVHVTPLSALPRRILRLLDLPADLFEPVAHRISNTPLKMSAP